MSSAGRNAENLLKLRAQKLGAVEATAETPRPPTVTFNEFPPSV